MTEKAKLLVIDSNLGWLDFAAHTLRRAGYEIEVATDLVEACPVGACGPAIGNLFPCRRFACSVVAEHSSPEPHSKAGLTDDKRERGR